MAQLFLLYVNTKSAWWWLTYSLFEIAGRSQRRAFLKTTVILKPQKGLCHPQSYLCVTNNTWHLHQSISCLEDCIVSGNLEGSLWVLMKMTNVVIWLILWGEGKSKVVSSTFEWIEKCHTKCYSETNSHSPFAYEPLLS